MNPPGFSVKTGRWTALALIGMGALASCQRVTALIFTYDPLGNIPDKGYVEFSYPAGQDFALNNGSVKVLELRGGKLENAHPIDTGINTRKRRIAKPAGKHTFTVVSSGKYSDNEEIEVEVVPGMVIPVLIVVRIVGPGYFELSLEPGSPYRYSHQYEYVRSKPDGRRY